MRPLFMTACALLAMGCASQQPPTRLTAAQLDRPGQAQVVEQAVVSLSEPRRSQFRLAAEAGLGNIDRAQPLSARILDVDVVLAAADADTKAKRNRYVGLLIAASNQRCSAYKEILSETDREGNFLFGALSTILGGLGAIFTPAATARSLAGAAGISSGLRSDFNSSFFYEKTIALLVKSIDDQRTKALAEIRTRMNDESVDKWPFPMALGEVQLFHDLCSLSGAFAGISDAVNRAPPESLETQLTRQALANALVEYGTRCTSLQTQGNCDSLQKRIDALRGQLPKS